MKIHILPVPNNLQPIKQKRKFPVHNEDYGIEQDFLAFLKQNEKVKIVGADIAEWHYLPIFWTRWAVNSGLKEENLNDLKKHINNIVIDRKKTFTICQHKDAPFIPLREIKTFLASRSGVQGIDVPLLSSPHTPPGKKPSKKYLASFVGNMKSHPIREELFHILENRSNVLLLSGNKGEGFFIEKTLQSYSTLCPRGMGGSSFRFYESLQLGVVPIMIGDVDTRPFKKYIDWDKVSFYVKTPLEASKLVDKLDKKLLLKMGESAAKLWEKELTYQKWCKYVLLDMEAEI